MTSMPISPLPSRVLAKNVLSFQAKPIKKFNAYFRKIFTHVANQNYDIQTGINHEFRSSSAWADFQSHCKSIDHPSRATSEFYTTSQTTNTENLSNRIGNRYVWN